MTQVSPSNFKEYFSTIQKISQQLAQGVSPAKTAFPYLGNPTNNFLEGHNILILGVIGCIPEVGAFISSAVSLVLFPPWEKSTNPNLDLWNSIQSKVSSMVEDGIVKLSNYDLIGSFNVIKSRFQTFTETRMVLQLKKGTPTNVPDLYIQLERKISETLIELKALGDEFKYQQISMFALIATIHIAVLNDGIKNGKNFGLDKGDANETNIKRLKKDLLEKVPTYIAHLKHSCEYGIYRIENLPNVPTSEKFRRILDFRNHCSQFVFDYVESWQTFDDTIYPNGAYHENVRFLWQIVGTLYDQGYKRGKLLVPNEENYFNPPLASIWTKIKALNFDMYPGELKKTELTYDPNFIYACQSFYDNGEKPGTLVPEQRIGAGKIPPKATIQSYNITPASYSYSASWDISPRAFAIGLESTVLTPHRSFAAHLPHSQRYFEEICPYSHIAGKFYANHKIGIIRGRNENVSAVNSDTWKQKYYEASGFLDCMFVGFLPHQVFNYSTLFTDRATIINAQKFIGGNRMNVRLAYDHVYPTVHSVSMAVKDNLVLKYSLKFYNDKPTPIEYEIGIRYHNIVPKNVVIIQDPSSKNIFSMTLDVCNNKGGNEYKTKFYGSIDFTKHPTYTISVKCGGPGDFFLQSVILRPKVVAK
ncbi:hypothetical protein DICPUDRAFT_96621 [Dictyostelium purpureum]|uniref:Pesticidal crystal protein domain-containing protein n=1 Tax=Dictyostelium purpureum TaxID=5786 RepID=F0ZA04_DICPU|nr:uncharacterized protein DICPUDRAFT_96621 [Dictyostelium purpureum]EGC39242.1 hypothetical protein DICPUDRAFT_96621 [Dictyostelium purpureum]|eukprot:XP_003284269.1 hypothetical protein DICPUDRAFT_96621 [Dictyostelium purpureum]